MVLETFVGGVQEGPPIVFPHSWIVFEQFWKKWVWGLGWGRGWGSGGSGGLPNEDSYRNSRSTARHAAAS